MSKKHSQEVVDGKKWCAAHGVMEPIENFGLARNRKSGYHSYCRPANIASSAQSFQKKKTADPCYSLACHLSNGARVRARVSGKSIDLNYMTASGLYSDVRRLQNSNCPLCNQPFCVAAYKEGGRKGAKSNSITLDCLNPDEGYTRDNIRFICYRCNRMKSAHTIQSALALVQWLLRGGPDLNHEENPCTTHPILSAQLANALTC